MVGPPPESWVVAPEDASAHELRPGLWRLRLPMPAFVSHVNAYAVALEDGGVMLVDCGSAGDETLWEALVLALRAAGFSVGDVRRLVLTHYHTDHAGLAPRLVAESGCEVLGHPDPEHFNEGIVRSAEVGAARELVARREGAPEAIVAVWGCMDEEAAATLGPVRPDRPLDPGDTIDSALGAWTVIDTAGHAPSHIALLQRETGVLIVGDTIAPAFYYFFEYGWSPDSVGDYFLAFERLDGLEGVGLTLPGHGGPMTDLHAAVAAWRTELHRRVDATEAAIGAGAATAWEAASRTNDVEAAGPWACLHLGEAVAYLQHLRGRGRVVRRTELDGSYRYKPS
jgi:glyoxylase-like metal-dependent hydrolase (beta-lactamase superfamily II)